MKAIQVSKLLVLALVLTAAAVGCKKTPVKVQDMYGNRPPYGSESGNNITNLDNGKPITSTDLSSSTNAAGIPQESYGKWDKYIAHPEILKDDSIYFDYDSSVIKAGERQKLGAVADYLKAHPDYGIRVEGNCDERGTEGYNMSLGERRALAAREFVAEQGGDPNKVPTVSNGKDKPVAQGHDESAWHLNRRDDFIVLTPPGAPAP